MALNNSTDNQAQSNSMDRLVLHNLKLMLVELLDANREYIRAVYFCKNTTQNSNPFHKFYCRYHNIYMSNGVSLHELSISLSKGQKMSNRQSDDLCSICSDGGQLLLCDTCPRAFHRGNDIMHSHSLYEMLRVCLLLN
jgi:hypothetical protein